MSFRSNQGFLAAVKATFPSIPACLSVCLPDCLPAADPPVYASISICLQSCRLTSLGSSVPMCDLRVQRKLFLPQHFQHSFFLSQHFCVFAPVFLGHSLAVWVALALQNMPPKARAPEARMVFGWGQVCGVEICTCSGPSRCLPTVPNFHKRYFQVSPKLLGFGEACFGVMLWRDIMGFEIWLQACQWFGFAFRLCSWNCMLARLFGFVHMKIQ